MVGEPDVWSLFPSDGSASRRPLPSLSVDRQARGPLGEGSPASRVLWDAPTPDRPSRRASFPSLGGTPLRRGRPGLPGSWGARVHVPCSLTPAGSATPDQYSAPMLPSALPRASAPATIDFGAQSHGPHTRCLRFAGRVAPPPRKTRFRLLATLCRAGLATRWAPQKVSASCFDMASSFPRLLLAHGRFSVPVQVWDQRTPRRHGDTENDHAASSGQRR